MPEPSLRRISRLVYSCCIFVVLEFWGSSLTGKRMQRLTARFLLLFALLGTLAPPALQALTPVPHACCLRKGTRQCHGSIPPDRLAISDSSCCSFVCGRGVTICHWAYPAPALKAISALGVGELRSDYRQRAPASVVPSSQSTRAPPAC